MGLEKALNHYLKLSSDTMERMSELAGKVIHIRLRGLPFDFYLVPDHDKLHVNEHYIGQVDTTTEGSVFDFLCFEGITIQGDSEVAHQLAKIFTMHEIDWEEHLSYYFGDLIANQLSRFIKQFIDYFERTKQHLELDLGEYIQEEMKVTPQSEAVEDFITQVDLVRDEVARLEAHIKQLRS